jgi:hypothetical protein
VGWDAVESRSIWSCSWRTNTTNKAAPSINLLLNQQVASLADLSATTSPSMATCQSEKNP